MSTKRRIPAVLFSLAAILTAADNVLTQQGELLREEFHQTYPVSGDARLSLENINGAVRVTAWDRNEVKVDAVKSAYHRDRLDEAKIVVRADANIVHIETHYPDEPQNSTGGDLRLNNPAKVEYVLTVPRSVRIDSIEVMNGDLDIDGITGDVRVSVINGRVSGRELTGEVKLSTVNGKVEAIFSRLNESKGISLGSVAGPVVLTIPSDANAEVKARTVHGSIDNDFGLPVRRGDYAGSDLAGQLGQGGPRIKLGNVSGAISIKHAADGRPLSRVTSLVAEKIKNKDAKHDDDDFDVDEKRSEERRIKREATRDATRSQRDARRIQLESQRAQVVAQRALRRAEVQTARAQIDAQRVTVEALKPRTAKPATKSEEKRAMRELQLKARRVQLDAARINRSAQAEAQRSKIESRRARVEVSRAQIDEMRLAREMQRAVQVEAGRIRVAPRRIARAASRVDRANAESVSSLRLVERESKTFAVTGTPQIYLQTFDGYITVRGWDKQEVQLTVNKRAATEQQMRGISLKSDQKGSTINVIAGFDQSFSRRDPNSNVPNAVVNLDLYVPRSSMLRLTTGDGRLEIDGVRGDLSLKTGDGRIDVRDARGRLVAKTGDGRIQVENFDGEVEAQTEEGRILLNGRFGQLSARTGSGSILLTVPPGFNATLETDAESVENEGLALTAQSGSSKRVKRWKIGQGGKLLRLRTAEGRIFLRSGSQ